MRDEKLGYLWNGYSDTYYLEGISVSSMSEEVVTEQQYAMKLDGASDPWAIREGNWASEEKYVRANLLIDGYSNTPPYSQGKIEISKDSIHFVTVKGFSTAGKSLDMSKLRLSKQQKDLLLKSPKDFVAEYGPYYISQIMYGGLAVCQYTIQGQLFEDIQWLSGAFKEITSDVFFNEAMSHEFEKQISWTQLNFAQPNWRPEFKCFQYGGPSIDMPSNPSPFQAQAVLDTWWDGIKSTPSLMLPQRAKINLITDLQEVQEALQAMPLAKQAPLTDVQRLTSSFALTLEQDLAKSMWIENSVFFLKPSICWSNNGQYHKPLLNLVSDIGAYLAKVRKLSGSDLSNLQGQFATGNYKFLEATGFNEIYVKNVQLC